MSTEFWLLCILIAVVLTWIIRLKRDDKDAQTWRQTHYANARLPFIFEQRDATPEAAQAAKDEYDECVRMLSECGNKHLTKEDIHLWLFLADERTNATIDFDLWKLKKAVQRYGIFQPYLSQKSDNAKGDVKEAGKVIYDFDDVQRSDK